MEDRTLLAETWPLFGLEVRTPRLVLRLPTDAELVALAGLTGDIHDPDRLPFVTPWSLAPDVERERGTLQFHWLQRALWSPTSWQLLLVTVVDGEIVGTQGLVGDQFPVRRTVSSGSWLHRPRQGEGIGTEMREAILHLAFVGLGADRAETCAFTHNVASQRVSEKAGYARDGEAVVAVDGRREREVRYALDRSRWEGRRRDDIELVGLGACRELFGA